MEEPRTNTQYLIGVTDRRWTTTDQQKGRIEDPTILLLESRISMGNTLVAADLVTIY